MAYPKSNPVARKSFTFARVLLLFFLNVKFFLVTGFEFGYTVTEIYFSASILVVQSAIEFCNDYYAIDSIS